jgi:predicted dehydrogenase
MATHLYDLLEHFAGPIRRVTGFQRSLVHSYKSEDTSTTLLEFASGAQASVDCCFCIPDEASRTRLEIYGSKGAVLTEGTIGQSAGGKAEVIVGLGVGGYDATQNKDVVREFRPLPFEAVDPYTAECEYFAECVLSGRAPEINTGAQGVRVVRIAELAYEACRTNRILEVD